MEFKERTLIGIGVLRFPGTMSDEVIDALVQSIPPPAEAVGLPVPPDPEMSWGDVARDMGRKAGAVARWGTDVVTRAALPTLGGLAGAGVGVLPALIPGGAAVTPYTTPAMSGLGAMAGVKANELIGLEQPTGLDYALAGGGALLGPATRFVVPRMPGAAGGLQEVAVTRAAGPSAVKGGPLAIGAGGTEGLAGTITRTVGGQSADALYDQVRALNPRVPTQPIQDALATFRAGEADIVKAGKDPTVRKALAMAEQLLHPIPHVNTIAADFNMVWANMKRLGDLAQQAEAKGADIARVVNGIKAGYREALDQAATDAGPQSQAGQLLRAANQAYRREQAADEIRDVIAAGLGRGGPGLREGNYNAMLAKLDKGKVAENLADIMKTDPALAKEIDGIRTTLTELTKTPMMGQSTQIGVTPGAAPYGMRHIVGSVLGAGAGGAAGGALGLGALGIGAGAAGGVTAAILVTEALTNGMMSAPGRAMIVGLAKHGYGIDQIATVLAQAARPAVPSRRGTVPAP